MDFTSKTYLISQAFALLAMIVYVVCQQYKRREPILVGFIIGNLLNAIHMFLLGAATGTALSIIGAIRFSVAIFSQHRIWLFIFLLINTIVTWYIFEGYILSFTSYIGATFIIFSSFLKSDHWMRITMILGGIAWLIYGILVGSIVAIIANGLFVISSAIGWYRHIYRKS